jgi:uncharacterized membrane protein YhhN
MSLVPIATSAAYFGCLAGYSWFYNPAVASAPGFLGLWALHFARRGLESLFVAKYERPTKAIEVIGALVYYWGFGAWNGCVAV